MIQNSAPQTHSKPADKNISQGTLTNIKAKKVLIMAGGTGGHVFPGISLAKELAERGVDVEWLGTRAGIESRLVPQAKITLNIFPVSGIRGKGAMAVIKAPFNIVRAIYSALKLVKRIAPDLVVGMGGFVAGPGAIAAKLRGIPLLIHEQNAVAGTTNRLLSPFANAVVSAFPVKLSGAQVLGNPVRSEIENLSCGRTNKISDENKINVLVIGGSRGALKINQFFPTVFKSLLEGSIKENKTLSLNIWHQSGGGKENATVTAYEANNIVARVEPFIDDMAKAYGWADLVICRSGALTVSEIAAAGLPSVLIPFPYAIDDHQTVNAKYLSDSNAAVIIQEKDFDAKSVASKILTLLLETDRLKVMAENARRLSKPNTAKKIIDICEELMNE